MADEMPTDAELYAALKLVEKAERIIVARVKALGLPISEYGAHIMLAGVDQLVRYGVSAVGRDRLFKDSSGKRNLNQTYNMGFDRFMAEMQEAANAFKAKKAR